MNNLFLQSLTTITAKSEWCPQVKNTTSKFFQNIFMAIIIAFGFNISATSTVQAAFTDVTDGAGLTSTWASRGAAWGDFNDDGCVDLYTTGFDGGVLYKSNCDGTFNNVTASLAMSSPTKSWAATWSDYDDDGDLDLYVTAHDSPNALYQNNGDGTFTNVAASAGVDDIHGQTGASFGDYDADGDLDLFVATRFDPLSTLDWSDRLYRNNGNGTFTDVTATAGVGGPDGRLTFTGVWFDYDNDADLDLYLAVDFGSDVLYSNNNDGTFTDVSSIAGISDPQHGMGVSVGDINLDGCFDVFSSNNNKGNDFEHRESVLYINNCDGTFSDKSVEMGIIDSGNVQWGVNFVDFDNDGDEDLSAVAGGMLSTGETNLLYENPNICGGALLPVTEKLGVQNTGATFGSMWVDYDSDGDLDWFVANETGSNKLFRNDQTSGNHLKVTLAGTQSNKDGVGAVVKVSAGGVTQSRVIQSGHSYASSGELTAFFGTGVKETVDQISVTWPSGQTSELTDVATNQNITIAESTNTVISGTTFAADGSPIALVRVRLRDATTGVIIFQVFSDSNGFYSITTTEGSYRVIGSLPGHRNSVPLAIDIAAGEAITADLYLRVR